MCVYAGGGGGGGAGGGSVDRCQMKCWYGPQGPQTQQGMPVGRVSRWVSVGGHQYVGVSRWASVGGCQ